ncbi:hypothetical protein JOD29_003212 [Lysinibacillus composti]|nr:hypothetical protein [Lysinibacillus composti]
MKKFSVPFIMGVREVKEVNALNFEGGFMLFIAFWTFVMVALMAIGGFFMFRKFLKALPKEDGRSDLDWQAYYIEKSLHLWGDEAKELLNELVSPVPELFRQTAKEKIAGKIAEIALRERVKSINNDVIIRGYIQATPKRDHKFLRKKLDEMKIDVSPYENLFE